MISIFFSFSLTAQVDRSPNKNKEKDDWAVFRDQIRTPTTLRTFPKFSLTDKELNELGTAIEKAACNGIFALRPYYLPEKIYEERILSGADTREVLKTYQRQQQGSYGETLGAYNVFPVLNTASNCGEYISGGRVSESESHLLFKREDPKAPFVRRWFYYTMILQKQSDDSWKIDDVYHYHMPSSVFFLRKGELAAYTPIEESWENMIGRPSMMGFFIMHHRYQLMASEYVELWLEHKKWKKKFQKDDRFYDQTWRASQQLTKKGLEIKYQSKSFMNYPFDNPNLKIIIDLEQLKLDILMNQKAEEQLQAFNKKYPGNLAGYQLAYNIYQYLGDKKAAKYAKEIRKLTKDKTIN